MSILQKRWPSLLALSVAAMGCGGCSGSSNEPTNPTGGDTPQGGTPIPPGVLVELTDHPRLIVRAQDLERLQSWAVPTNPIWVALDQLVSEKLKDYQNPVGQWSADPGAFLYNPGKPYTEEYFLLFAFKALMTKDELLKAPYVAAAHDLFMRLIHKFNNCPAVPDPKIQWCGPDFAGRDRASFWGQAYPLTLDWIYSSFSRDELAAIQKVFLRWEDDLIRGYHNYPVPIGVSNDPALVENDRKARNGLNNYYTAHLRHLTQMSLAFDAADDPFDVSGNTVRNYLNIGAGAYLYITDYTLRGGAARGDFRGMSVEGSEYGYGSMASIFSGLLSLSTTGTDDAALFGPQVVVANHPHWDNVAKAFFYTMEPAPSFAKQTSVGDAQVYQTITEGDCAETILELNDPMIVLGPKGIWDLNRGALGLQDLNMIRYIGLEYPAGGEAKLLNRIAKKSSTRTVIQAIYYFMVYDPSAAKAADPRPSLPLTYESPGNGLILARTSWKPDSAWLSYRINWASIDHQSADGNKFELYRKGQWLTKGMSGYGESVNASHLQNTVSAQNVTPVDPYGHKVTGISAKLGLFGDQWRYQDANAGDPLGIVAQSLENEGFLAVTGDATNLYNLGTGDPADNLLAADLDHVSRSLVWLKPDHVVVYDRIRGNSSSKAKSFWLNTQTLATIAGGSSVKAPGGAILPFPPAGADINVLSMNAVSVGGVVTKAAVHPVSLKAPKSSVPMVEQTLFLTTLLPTSVAITASPPDDLAKQRTKKEPMQFVVRIEAMNAPKDVTFLNVLQGADAGDAPSPVSRLILKQEGDITKTPFEGALVDFGGGDKTLVLFPRRLGETLAELHIPLSFKAKKTIVTGLQPGVGYAVTNDGGATVIMPDGNLMADSGGVLAF